MPIDPDTELYGPVLFQGTRFQRLLGYRALAATGCVAEISNASSHPWFAGYLPHELVLGDPGTRDAMMHTLQCCVPDATLLPAGLERLYLADADTVRRTGSAHPVCGRNAAGTVTPTSTTWTSAIPLAVLVERWEGLKLRAVRKQDGSGPWLASLLGPYLERRTEPVLGRWLHCAVYPDGARRAGRVAARRELTGKAVDSALGGHRHAELPAGRQADDGLRSAGVLLARCRGDASWSRRSAIRSPATSSQRWPEPPRTGPACSARRRPAWPTCSPPRPARTSRCRRPGCWGAIECLRKAGRASAEP